MVRVRGAPSLSFPYCSCRTGRSMCLTHLNVWNCAARPLRFPWNRVSCIWGCECNWRFVVNQSRSIVIRGSRIFEDEYGLICLDDLWRAAKALDSKAPAKWRRGRMANALIIELEKKIRISSLKENKTIIPAIYSKRGRGSTGTYAHPILAAAYAGYLSPKLERSCARLAAWLRRKTCGTISRLLSFRSLWRPKHSPQSASRKSLGLETMSALTRAAAALQQSARPLRATAGRERRLDSRTPNRCRQVLTRSFQAVHQTAFRRCPLQARGRLA